MKFVNEYFMKMLTYLSYFKGLINHQPNSWHRSSTDKKKTKSLKTKVSQIHSRKLSFYF